MALSGSPRTFQITGACTLADLREIVAQTTDEPENTEVRVHVRAGFHRDGAAIRTVALVARPQRTD